jgi:hypothetical protein
VRTEEPPARSFDASSSVTTYWLARCEGFEVRAGRKRGVVEAVALETLSDRAAYLIVRFTGRRRHMITPESVRAVVPAEELLLLHPLESRPSRLAPAARRVREQSARAAETGARASVTATSAAARASTAAAATTWRGSTRASEAAWRELQRLDRWLEPRTAAAWLGLRRGIATAWAETKRFGRWLSPRAATAARSAWAWVRTAALATVAAATALARRVRADGTPVARAAVRWVSGTVAGARAWLTGAEQQDARRPGRAGAEDAPAREHADAGDDDASGRAA